MVTLSSNSGKSIQDAIVITDASGSVEGVQAEYTYLERKYGRRGSDWVLLEQQLLNFEGKYYDKLIIRLKPSGETIELFFDITSFFGKEFGF